jgi:hypothetical protein
MRRVKRRARMRNRLRRWSLVRNQRGEKARMRAAGHLEPSSRHSIKFFKQQINLLGIRKVIMNPSHLKSLSATSKI